jgi:hypothetical protein
MVAFPPHLQLAFLVTSELALSVHTYGLRFWRLITLAFFVSLAVSSLSDSPAGSAFPPAGSAFWPASSIQSHSTLLFSSAWLTCVKGLRYGCLSLSITSVSSRDYSMLTACVEHSAFERDCDSFDIVTTCAASIPIVFFACQSYVYGHYRNLASSFASFAIDIGSHQPSVLGSLYACKLCLISRPQSSVLHTCETHFQPWFSWIPFDSRFAACDLFRFRLPSKKRSQTHIITRICLDCGLRTQLLPSYAHRISTPSDVAISTRACAVGLRFGLHFRLVFPFGLRSIFVCPCNLRLQRTNWACTYVRGCGFEPFSSLRPVYFRSRFRPYIYRFLSVLIISTSSSTLRLRPQSFSFCAGHPYVYGLYR